MRCAYVSGVLAALMALAIASGENVHVLGVSMACIVSFMTATSVCVIFFPCCTDIE